MLVPLGCGVGVVETWCWCTTLPSGCDVGVVRTRWRCHRGVVLVSSGGGVGVEVVDAQAVSATVHGTPHPSHSTHPSWISTSRFQSVCRVLSSSPTMDNMMSCTAFTSAASTSPLILLSAAACHWCRGRDTTAVCRCKDFMQATEANAVKSWMVERLRCV